MTVAICNNYVYCEKTIRSPKKLETSDGISFHTECEKKVGTYARIIFAEFANTSFIEEESDIRDTLLRILIKNKVASFPKLFIAPIEDHEVDIRIKTVAGLFFLLRQNINEPIISFVKNKDNSEKLPKICRNIIKLFEKEERKFKIELLRELLHRASEHQRLH